MQLHGVTLRTSYDSKCIYCTHNQCNRVMQVAYHRHARNFYGRHCRHSTCALCCLLHYFPEIMGYKRCSETLHASNPCCISVHRGMSQWHFTSSLLVCLNDTKDYKMQVDKQLIPLLIFISSPYLFQIDRYKIQKEIGKGINTFLHCVVTNIKKNSGVFTFIIKFIK